MIMTNMELRNFRVNIRNFAKNMQKCIILIPLFSFYMSHVPSLTADQYFGHLKSVTYNNKIKFVN